MNKTPNEKIASKHRLEQHTIFQFQIDSRLRPHQSNPDSPKPGASRLEIAIYHGILHPQVRLYAIKQLEIAHIITFSNCDTIVTQDVISSCNMKEKLWNSIM